MDFFRNKEIKTFSILLLAICVIAVVTGFLIHRMAGLFGAVLCAVFCMAFFIFTKKRYRKISTLSEQIDAVLHGNDSIDISHFDEGELSILQSEIYKMTVRLREHSDLLKKDKLHLANAMADIAHQLRTPLTSINMILSFLEPPDLEKQKRIQLIHEAQNLLTRIDWLMASLLKMSKIDAGTAIFKREAVLVHRMLEKAAEPLSIPLELREIALCIEGEASAQFTGDLNWTAEAFGNMMKNCMEHTASGGKIVITFSENTVFTEIIIRDNGTGIDPGDLPHIFERFYQGKHNKEGNFGIGLALCRMILSRQNATVKAYNHADGGACFCIRFYHHIL